MAAEFQYHLGNEIYSTLRDEIQENDCLTKENYDLLRIALQSLAGAMSFYSTIFDTFWEHECSKPILTILLQLEYNNVQVIGLDLLQRDDLLCYFTTFEDALLFSYVYGIEDQSKWINPLIQQCVIMNNRKYFDDWSKEFVMSQDTLNGLKQRMLKEKIIISQQKSDDFIKLCYIKYPHLLNNNKDMPKLVHLIKTTTKQLSLNMK